MARSYRYSLRPAGVAVLRQVLGQGGAGLVYVIESFLARIATVVNGKLAVSP
jgi:hypothetical protein